MFDKLKAAWARLAGAASGAADAAAAPPVEYKGYRIRPAPYRANGHYQTAGTIEKDTPDGVKEHKFIRADTYQNRDDAIAFTISKAKQIIDNQGDKIFTCTGERRAPACVERGLATDAVATGCPSSTVCFSCAMTREALSHCPVRPRR